MYLEVYTYIHILKTIQIYVNFIIGDLGDIYYPAYHIVPFFPRGGRHHSASDRRVIDEVLSVASRARKNFQRLSRLIS